jgi:hypothetical protein
MAVPKPQSCAHPGCSCLVTAGKYCSIECESMAKTPDSDCMCPHTECKGNAQSVAPSPFEIPS